jgi:hypothetical protein
MTHPGTGVNLDRWPIALLLDAYVVAFNKNDEHVGEMIVAELLRRQYALAAVNADDN